MAVQCLKDAEVPCKRTKGTGAVYHEPGPSEAQNLGANEAQLWLLSLTSLNKAQWLVGNMEGGFCLLHTLGHSCP